MDPSARRSFHIGRYHCTETLAQGALGETFRAKVYGVAGLEKQYALKQIEAGLRVDPEARQRLVQAARLYATLEHERIARLTEIQDEGDTLFLVTELARGIDLPRLVNHLRGRNETLPIEQAILIVADVAEALEVASRPSEAVPGGVPHLGLHPGAVSVLSEGEVRVCDFAIASALERPGWEADDQLCGALSYVAPERLGGAASATSDTWAVGAILFELCAGVPFVVGATVAEQQAARRSPPWDRLPTRAGLQALLERLLSADPAARPAGAALREALAGLLGLELTRARVGLQGLVKRALGRTLTRTGSFAAVAIPSLGTPTLVQEPPSSPPVAGGPRTLLGTMAHAATAPATVPTTPARAWTPPRQTALLQAVNPSVPTTLPGLGATPAPADDPPQMELAELPPENDTAITERTIKVVPFDDGGTAPAGGTAPEGSAPESEAVELELDVQEVTEIRPPPPPPPPPPSPSRSMPVVVPPPDPPITPLTPAGPMAPIEDSQLDGVTAPIPMAVRSPPAPAPSTRAPAPTGRRQRGNGVWIGVGVAALAVVAAWKVAREQRGWSPTTPVVESTAPKAEVVAKPEAGKPVPPPAKIETMVKIETPTKIEPTTKEPPAKIEPPAKEPPTAKIEPPAKVEAKPEPAKVALAPKVESPPPKIESAPAKVEPAPAKVEPAPAAAAGQLTLSTTPPGATVWIDGEPRGQTPLRTPATAGAHRVILSAPGMKQVQKTVTIGDAGATLELNLEPAKLPAELVGGGGLKVRCRTLGELRILVDGHDTGMVCPNPDRISVTPGPHKIGLLSPRTGEVKEIDGEIDDDPDHSTRIYVRY
jgi:serine/threonine-protein kinase